jgi:type IV secretion system protein VirB9
MNARQWLCALQALVLLAGWDLCRADVRLRDVLYDVNEVYRLPAYAGYETDIEFERGEHFVGLGSGDLKGLAFHAELNHLFVKPRAINVNTDITVLTNRRVYQFDFVSVAHAPDDSHADVLYALRFLYPSAEAQAVSTDHRLTSASPMQGMLPAMVVQPPVNRDYWYCGAVALQPAAAWDDGLQTHLRFRARQEMPALFLKNEDGSESLLNFHIDHDEVVVHRVVQRLILRRGGLVGCVTNRSYPAPAGPGKRSHRPAAAPPGIAQWQQ